MTSIHDWYLYWALEIQNCYATGDINKAWHTKYEVTNALQQIMNVQVPLTRQTMETMTNLLKLESEISIFIYLIINRQMNDPPLDYSIVTLERR